MYSLRSFYSRKAAKVAIAKGAGLEFTEFIEFIRLGARFELRSTEARKLSTVWAGLSGQPIAR